MKNTFDKEEVLWCFFLFCLQQAIVCRMDGVGVLGGGASVSCRVLLIYFSILSFSLFLRLGFGIIAKILWCLGVMLSKYVALCVFFRFAGRKIN